MKNFYIENACEIVGGQAAMARLLNVSISAVSQWVLGIRPIPIRHCPKIEKATNRAVTCEQLAPEVDWAYVRGTKRKAA